jgi:thiamine transport system ATP-binding protein
MLALRDVTVQFGAITAVDAVHLDLGESEQLSILGPSGSGKSTVLRAVAGLERLASGHVEWDGRDVADVPTHRRGFGLMFQDYVLFPHMDVATNVGFGLDAGGAARDERTKRVAEVLDLVGLSGYEKRLPAQLSGGEQQRVALARALAPGPRLLMLDEPLGALDRSLRRDLLDELIAIFGRVNAPLIYVTHDHEEALAVGDRVGVMRAGRLETVLPPAELWQHPPTEFVARFLGFGNIVDAEVVDGGVQTPIGVFEIASGTPGTSGRAAPPAGDSRHVRLFLRPDAFRPDPGGNVTGTVHSVTFRGDHTMLRIDVPAKGGELIRLEVEWRGMPVPEIGNEVRLAIDPAGLVLLPLT